MADEQDSRRNRQIVAYAIASTVVLAIAALVFVLASGDGDDGGEVAEGAASVKVVKGTAHINVASGSTNGLKPDNRGGTPPPSVETTELAEAAEEAGCDVLLEREDEGHAHFPPNTPKDYGTNPPTSGEHVEPPYQQADGAYAVMPGEPNVVHALEHGRLAIQYSPKLPEAEQLELKGLYDTMYGATLFFPNTSMPYEVAATTWTNLIGCLTYEGAATLDAIRAFGKATWGRYGGEPAEAFTFTGPTPAEPAEPAE